LLVHNGKLFQKALDHVCLTRRELMSALRQAGCAGIQEVHVAMLGDDGNISVNPRGE
jgi:uncharacterized membrane protein YcaP (DUF421 family)